MVNADDFGMSPGVNLGIVRAHVDGVVTSASLMVDAPGSEAAARSARELPRLGLGLHATLTEETGEPRLDFDAPAAVRAELLRQLQRFRELAGAEPDHLDAHHNVHRDPRTGPVFVEVADGLGVPLRESSAVRYFSRFYGQWEDGESHPEWIGYDNLARMLAEEIGEGATELSCHPGFPEPGLGSSYARERAAEVATLCDPRLPGLLDELGYRLCAYRDLPLAVESVEAG